MTLVDYSSDSSSDPESESQPHPPKKRKSDAGPDAAALPPLPASFHDLYASTVRHSTGDDPSLHQGRTRQIPHVAGNWPSHLYIEWHPTPDQHALLTRLLEDLRRRISDDEVKLSTFLTSDLGAPQPLHISLSRPFVLATSEKDAFLDRIAADVGGCKVRPFELRYRGLEWHRTAESNRSFLVLRVRGASGAKDLLDGRRGAAAGDGAATDGDQNGSNANLELTELLRKCNAAVRAFNQPELYQQVDSRGLGAGVGEAFHVSVAWSFAKPDDELRRHTEEVSAVTEYATALTTMNIPVDGVKTKIGNVVTHIPLPERGARGKSRVPGGLFGI